MSLHAVICSVIVLTCTENGRWPPVISDSVIQPEPARAISHSRTQNEGPICSIQDLHVLAYYTQYIVLWLHLLHSMHMEGLYTIYRTHHIKGMMSPSYYINIVIIIIQCSKTSTAVLIEVYNTTYIACQLKQDSES